MKFIAHRGLYKGPGGLFHKSYNPQESLSWEFEHKENNPKQIDLAIQQGYDVEIDIRWSKDFLTTEERFYLGHNHGEYYVPLSWIHDRIPFLWMHCKNKEAAYRIGLYFKNANYFMHDDDDVVLTTKGYLWTYPKEDIGLTPYSIAVMPEKYLTPEKIFQPSYWERFKNCHAICTDYCDAINKHFS